MQFVYISIYSVNHFWAYSGVKLRLFFFFILVRYGDILPVSKHAKLFGGWRGYHFCCFFLDRLIINFNIVAQSRRVKLGTWMRSETVYESIYPQFESLYIFGSFFYFVVRKSFFFGQFCLEISCVGKHLKSLFSKSRLRPKS